MDLLIAFMVVIQAIVVIVLARTLKRDFIAKLGFLLMASTFAYHGLGEVIQYVFPGHNPYRSIVTDSSLRIWIVLITGSMCTFTLVYYLTIRQYRWFRLPSRKQQKNHRLSGLLLSLSGTYLLKWQVLFILGLLGFVIVDLEKVQGAGYVSSGIADQFAALIFSISLTTLCVMVRTRWHLALFVLYAAIVAVNGSRLLVVLTILTAISAATRYGRAISARTIVGAGSILLVMSAAVSVVRGDHGIFRNEEALTRLEAFNDRSEGTQDTTDRLVEDSVYRLDGNSYGAMIVEKQLGGYGSTGFSQIMATIQYNIPSFIFRGKLDLDGYLRNEEAYQDQFYGFADDIDYISDFWSLMIGYVGIIGFVLAAPCLGWLFGMLDNWLSTSVSVTSYVCGICLSIIPMDLELGIAGIPYTLRGLAVFLIAVQMLRIRRRTGRSQRSTPVSAQPVSAVPPERRAPALLDVLH